LSICLIMMTSCFTVKYNVLLKVYNLRDRIAIAGNTAIAVSL